MPLNSSDGNKNTTNQQYKDGHKYVAAQREKLFSHFHEV